jgi:DNA-directed RNA polymerase specialized sigma24 family protein
MLGIPVGTVKWRISEARKKVREKLAAIGYVDAK